MFKSFRFVCRDRVDGGGGAVTVPPDISTESRVEVSQIVTTLNGVAQAAKELSAREAAQSQQIIEVTAAVKRADELSLKAAADAAKAAEVAEAMRAMHRPSDAGVGRDRGRSQIRSLRAVPVPMNPEDLAAFGLRNPPDAAMWTLVNAEERDLRLQCDAEVVQDVLDWRRMVRSMHLVDSIMRHPGIVGHQAAREYEEAGGWESLPQARKFKELSTAFRQALDEDWYKANRAVTTTGAGTGLEWVPTSYSNQLFDDVRDHVGIADAIEWFPLSRSPQTKFVRSTPIQMFLMDQQPTSFPTSPVAANFVNLATGSVTFTARKLMAIITATSEMIQDSVFEIAAAAGVDFAFATAFALDNILINGQVLGSTIDNVANFPSSADQRYLAPGLRHMAKLVTGWTPPALTTGISADAGAQMIGRMGKYAKEAHAGDLVWETGYAGVARLLLAKDANNRTLYLAKQEAGDIAAAYKDMRYSFVFMGFPVKVSGAHPSTLDATGIIPAAPSTKTNLLLFNRSILKGGMFQSLTVEASNERYFDSDVTGIRGKTRVDLKSIVTASATRPFVVDSTDLATF